MFHEWKRRRSLSVIIWTPIEAAGETSRSLPRAKIPPAQARDLPLLEGIPPSTSIWRQIIGWYSSRSGSFHCWGRPPLNHNLWNKLLFGDRACFLLISRHRHGNGAVTSLGWRQVQNPRRTSISSKKLVVKNSEIEAALSWHFDEKSLIFVDKNNPVIGKTPSMKHLSLD